MSDLWTKQHAARVGNDAAAGNAPTEADAEPKPAKKAAKKRSK